MTTTTQTTDSAAARDWTSAPLNELIDHILDKHHVYLREHLPHVQAIFERIMGKNPDKVCGFVPNLAKTFLALKEDLESHLLKEEQILFPHIRRLEDARNAGQPAPAFHCGTVAGPITQMEHEHANGKKALDEMSRLTAGYPLEDGMCANRRALFESLRALEADLLQHMHLENDILHPRARSLEQSA